MNVFRYNDYVNNSRIVTLRRQCLEVSLQAAVLVQGEPLEGLWLTNLFHAIFTGLVLIATVSHRIKYLYIAKGSVKQSE